MDKQRGSGQQAAAEGRAPWRARVLGGLCLLLGACSAEQGPTYRFNGPDWYDKTVFYELWVRSYQDSDGDGIGDLRGLKRRLPYLSRLGVGGIWLMPIYPSPLFDSGYDVADYRGIHPDYGTLDDFRDLLREAHALGIRVLMDLVFNHTSSEHAWFQQSRSQPQGPRGDWFVWADSPGLQCDGANAFGGERWTLDPGRQQYYFHQFYPQQPDLNFASPEMQQALLEVARYWLELGVDGFRLDVADRYVERLPACQHQPETRAFHRRLRQVLDGFADRTMIGEVLGQPAETLSYLGSGQDGLHMVFDFEGMNRLWGTLTSGKVALLQEHLTQVLAQLPAGGGVQALTLGNHDQLRLPVMVGDDPRTLALAATAQLTLPGVPFLYYGEELGLPSGTKWIVDFRDTARAPMPWDSSANAGFSRGEPFLPLAPGSAELNAAAQDGAPDSLLTHYRRLVALRNRTPALQTGRTTWLQSGDPSVLAFVRSHAEGDRLVLLCFSVSDPVQLSLSLPGAWSDAAQLTDELSHRRVGQLAQGRWSGELAPRSALILRR